MAGKASTVTVEFVGDADKLKKTFAETEAKTGAFGGRMTKVLAVSGAAMGAGVLAAAPALWKTGNELESMGAKVDTVFGSAGPKVEKWAQESSAAMGLSSQRAQGLAANFADLLVPMGFTQGAAADMSTKVVGLSGALSAWSNGTKSAADVSAILSKAMLGERDGLKELGISISDADVKARLLAKGQGDLTGAMLQQATAVATSEMIFEKSKDAQTAFADSTQTNAEKALVAKGRMSELTDKLATGLVPVFAKVTEAGLKVLGFVEGLNGGVLVAIGVVVGLVGAAFAITKAVQAWTLVQGAFNVVMAANPIVLVVLAIAALVGAVVWAYNNVAWFRDGVQAAFGGVVAAFKWMGSAGGVVLGAIVDAFSWVVGVVSGLPGRISSAASGMWDGLKNAFKSALNWIIRGWNSLQFKIPGFSIGPVKFGDFTLGVPPITPLAKGGIVTRPTLALIGEAGPEAVVPLSRGGMAGAGTTVFNVSFNGVTTREAAEQVVAVLEDHFGRGGSIGNGRGGQLAPS